jgi:hypothetical protein
MPPPLNWWASVNDGVDGQVRKGLNPIIILGALALQTHHNQCVFNDVSPFLTGAVSLALS